MEWKQANYYISTEKNKLDIDVIHYFLSKESYWAQDIPRRDMYKKEVHP